jgi:Uma2 family endonuclease
METVAENPSKNYTVTEYLAMEETALEKHEFFNGKIVKMPGARPKHNLIAANMITQLNLAIEKKQSNLLVLTSDTKIHIPQLNTFVYPDAVVVCEKVELYPGSETVITNPLLIVEVLSQSTEHFDRTTKFYYYKQIPSFKEYVLVEQNRPYVTASLKIAERTWQDTYAEGPEVSIHLQSIDCTISLLKITRVLSSILNHFFRFSLVSR